MAFSVAVELLMPIFRPGLERVSNLKLKFCVYLHLTGHDEIVRRLKDLIDLYMCP